jgi:hypothetical protein
VRLVAEAFAGFEAAHEAKTMPARCAVSAQLGTLVVLAEMPVAE